jgi:deoxyribodipyrimidine photolyase-related protein
MRHTALILGDQLMRENPALDGARRVLLLEPLSALRRWPVHRRRAHVVLSAIRHFVRELEQRGEVQVVHRRDVASFAEGLRDERDVVCVEPNSLAARRHLERLGVRFVASNQFLTSPERFAGWAQERRRLVMDDFYREQRRMHGVLLDERGQPEGGRWSFDRENRSPPVGGLRAPAPWQPVEDAVDAQVRRDLDALPGVHLWGQDGPRSVAVTPDEASRALHSFIDTRLALFGPWQDAMVEGEPVLFHSLLSAPMNLGVLGPLPAIRAAERAYRSGAVPIQSAEGFVRQILGWREYVWGIYWLRRERWPQENALNASFDLPDAFWGRTTSWNCLDTVVAQVQETGYAHHIQRLMVLGNVMLLAGVKPWQAVRWFQGVFFDGAEWVMAPNAAGMALYADDGQMTTKPYAAGGNYIGRMSNYCHGCRYDPHARTGEDACPLTALYWDFVDRHRQRFVGHPRMRLPLRGLGRIDDRELQQIRARARRARSELGVGEHD